MRAALWSSGDVIHAEDIEQALFQLPLETNDLMSLNVSQGIDIQKVISMIAGFYLRQALKLSSNNKTRAASLLGLKSQQTLSNWMKKYDIE